LLVEFKVQRSNRKNFNEHTPMTGYQIGVYSVNNFVSDASIGKLNQMGYRPAIKKVSQIYFNLYPKYQQIK